MFFEPAPIASASFDRESSYSVLSSSVCALHDDEVIHALKNMSDDTDKKSY